MTFPVTRNPVYDFNDETYADSYPNLHKYPATMLPQIGIEILHEFDLTSGYLLDPYCGSGSSFAAALECGIKYMDGYDINPLAVLISRAKFTLIDLVIAQQQKHQLNHAIQDSNDDLVLKDCDPITFFNQDYWFAPDVLKTLTIIHYHLQQVQPSEIRQLFSVAFAETLRDVSYTRNGEFKLYRIKPDSLSNHQPNVLAVFFSKLDVIIKTYRDYYYPKLQAAQIQIREGSLEVKEASYDVVLTSPPYGDSRTTVAYGQFSRFANEWLGVSYARKVDKMLMGGLKTERLYRMGIISEVITAVESKSRKRALEVSAFYYDLEKSIHSVGECIKSGGYAIYIVGNRRVKDIQLPTDQFIAEAFTNIGFEHCLTYERQIGGKVMPSSNSPSNVKGKTSATMSQEFIIVCRKR